jgi:hypothetical protein
MLATHEIGYNRGRFVAVRTIQTICHPADITPAKSYAARIGMPSAAYIETIRLRLGSQRFMLNRLGDLGSGLGRVEAARQHIAQGRRARIDAHGFDGGVAFRCP